MASARGESSKYTGLVWPPAWGASLWIRQDRGGSILRGSAQSDHHYGSGPQPGWPCGSILTVDCSIDGLRARHRDGEKETSGVSRV